MFTLGEADVWIGETRRLEEGMIFVLLGGIYLDR